MTDEISGEIARLIAGRMIERRDVSAVQSPDGAYKPRQTSDGEHIGFTKQAILDHLKGITTLGHYLVSPEGACRMLCFDVDLRHGRSEKRPKERVVRYRDGWPDQQEIQPREVWAGPTGEIKRDLAKQLQSMADILSHRAKELFPDAHVMVAYSGAKGMHVYGCLPPGTPAGDARDAAKMVLGSFVDTDGEPWFVAERGANFFRHRWGWPALSIEVFPKQASLQEGGFGNLIRLPLGVNQKSGKQGFFLDMRLPLGQFGKDDPLLALTQGSLR